jgi:hypothetical protein
MSPVQSSGERNASDPTTWARRVNSRWIAHHGLSETAGAYLDHLDRCDPDRLTRSCRRAHRLVRYCRPGEDPKPWFYAALFSLASDAEIERFLAGHWFTRAALPGRGAEPDPLPGPDGVGEETIEKLDRIRSALVGLRDND